MVLENNQPGAALLLLCGSGGSIRPFFPPEIEINLVFMPTSTYFVGSTGTQKPHFYATPISSHLCSFAILLIMQTQT